ncbi:TPA: PilL N-terminal domain-containing protein [Pseudomonas putida]|uniref:PFGI-1 class ICE element type IV pilus protein PilL2 n=1 Tax=Pseudomonas putida group TaxID=136845 RepID=UPI00110C9E86|nr:PilL N-terminal domain-containing protein [Pseudomonas putida]MDD1992782.1 PilL N-terminal domain-containing protein [Pseudomonas putida]HDS0918377.1 PilL N-terminal domain-containing protein [Pseudomonas putida]HDS0931658.1 PilL N-terminal domain-containing protein [Pseudomonas putida]HDS1782286.1 PilL N-terminal domain-containing protein [Pseudomonas putida]HDS3796935.1 PilL N-terminal domain-containing protein [Pseudomonas putida]
MHIPTLVTLGQMLTLLGCSTLPPAPVPAPPAPAPTAVAKPKSPAPVWVRQDRYTLASTRPTLEQRQPLYQLVNVQIAPALHATVREALRHVLQHSGYSLCPDSPAVARLFGHPLPAVHHDLGPISLLDALTVIGGPAWRLGIDSVERSVCYALRLPPPKPPVSTLETAP